MASADEGIWEGRHHNTSLDDCQRGVDQAVCKSLRWPSRLLGLLTAMPVPSPPTW